MFIPAMDMSANKRGDDVRCSLGHSKPEMLIRHTHGKLASWPAIFFADLVLHKMLLFLHSPPLHIFIHPVPPPFPHPALPPFGANFLPNLEAPLPVLFQALTLSYPEPSRLTEEKISRSRAGCGKRHCPRLSRVTRSAQECVDLPSSLAS